VSTNPLLTAFDQLNPLVKQAIISAHGLAPGQTDASAARPAPTPQLIPPIGGSAPAVPPIGGRNPGLAQREASIEAARTGDLGRVPPIGTDVASTFAARTPQVSNVQLPALHRAMFTNPSSVAPLGPEPAAMTIPPIGSGPDISSFTAGTVPHIRGRLAPRGTIEGDEAERTRLMTTGPGEAQIYGKITGSKFGQAHPLAGKILGGVGQGLATLGDVALSSVAPAVAINLPGTAYHHRMLENQANQAVAADIANAQQQAQTQEAQERTREMPEQMQRQMQTLRAGLAEHGLEMDDQGNITPVPEARLSPAIRAQLQGDWKPVAGAMGPNREPLEYNEKTGTYRPAPGTPGAQVQKQPNERPDTPEQQYIDEYQRLNPKATVGDAVKAYAAATQKPERGPTIIQQGAEIDRISGRLGKPHETAITAGNNQLDRMDEARAMINGSAEAQAFGIPKVLTALVSGQGTGVRITQPELNAIGRARGLAGDVQGSINALAGKGKLTKEQQGQITAILDDAKRRLQEKMNISNQALDAMNGAETRADVIAADKKARKQMSELEKTGHYEGQTITLKDGSQRTVTAIHPDGSFDAN